MPVLTSMAARTVRFCASRLLLSHSSPRPSTRLALAAAVALLAGGQVISSEAACPGTCVDDLVAHPAAVSDYAEAVRLTFLQCTASAVPSCPSPCLFPDPGLYSLNPECGDRIRCEIASIGGETSATWNAAEKCTSAPAAPCDTLTFKAASKLFAATIDAVSAGHYAQIDEARSACEAALPVCPTEESARTRACGVGLSSALGLFEDRFEACEAATISDAEISDAIEQALDRLKAEGVSIDTSVWEDPSRLFAIQNETYKDLDCAPDSSLAESLQARDMAALTPGPFPGDKPYDPAVHYCGPGDSDINPGFQTKPGDCLNRVCWEHDNCYSRVHENQHVCITKLCMWSPRSAGCDAPFLDGGVQCIQQGQCGVACRFTSNLVAILSGLRLYDPICGQDGACSCADGEQCSFEEGCVPDPCEGNPALCKCVEPAAVAFDVNFNSTFTWLVRVDGQLICEETANFTTIRCPFPLSLGSGSKTMSISRSGQGGTTCISVRLEGGAQFGPGADPSQCFGTFGTLRTTRFYPIVLP